MVGRGSDPLSESNVGNEAKRPIRFAEFVCMGIEKHLQHGDHVSGHFPAVITPAFARLFQPTSDWIGSFSQPEYRRSDARLAIGPGAANQEIGLDRKRNSGNSHFWKPGGILGRELPYPESVLRPLE